MARSDRQLAAKHRDESPSAYPTGLSRAGLQIRKRGQRLREPAAPAPCAEPTDVGKEQLGPAGGSQDRAGRAGSRRWKQRAPAAAAAALESWWQPAKPSSCSRSYNTRSRGTLTSLQAGHPPLCAPAARPRRRLPAPPANPAARPRQHVAAILRPLREHRAAGAADAAGARVAGHHAGLGRGGAGAPGSRQADRAGQVRRRKRGALLARVRRL